MAILEIVFYSQCLQRSVELRAIAPVDSPDGSTVKPKTPLPALYLLNGLFGSNVDWLMNTRVNLWAREKGLAVICPSGENSFYVDQAATGEEYSRFLGEELPDFCGRLLPLSGKREETYIGGLSMGGYGALLTGLRYPRVFSRIIALSSAIRAWERGETVPPEAPFVWQPSYAKALFGEDASKWDLSKLLRAASPKPSIYQACGLQDGLLVQNRGLAGELQRAGYDHTYEEGEGHHDWVFWDEYLKRALDWLDEGRSAAN